MAKSKKIEVVGLDIMVYSNMKDDFISLTDIAKFKNPQASADFKLVEFDQFKNEARYNHFTLSPKQWIENQSRSL